MPKYGFTNLLFVQHIVHIPEVLRKGVFRNRFPTDSNPLPNLQEMRGRIKARTVTVAEKYALAIETGTSLAVSARYVNNGKFVQSF